MKQIIKQFHEIGNNSYGTVIADNELYLVTSSFIPYGKSWFGRQKRFVQGLKLLRFTVPVAVLFQEIGDMKKADEQKYDGYDDMVVYKPLRASKVRKQIDNFYKDAVDSVTREAEKELQEFLQKGQYTGDDPYIYELTNNLNKLKKESYIPRNIEIDFVKGNKVIEAFLANNKKDEKVNYLYTEHVTSFFDEHYLYSIDCFGTVIIYRIKTVKGVIKDIETFMYNKEIIDKFLETMYMEGR